MKTCISCGSTKALNDFYRDAHGHKNTCKVCVRRRSSKHYRRNRSSRLAYVAKWRKQNPDKVRKYAKKYATRIYAALKTEVIAAYGGQCGCCGETEPVFLSIDHIHGGGTAHRRKIGWTHFYQFLKESGFPKDDYRLLCMNCQFGFRNGQKCPHQEKTHASRLIAV